jgi:hypothetical protein
MADTRQGLNTTLSYMADGSRRTYQVRTNIIMHGMTVLFDESASRTRRAFYPHRLTSAQFVLGIQLKGEDEYRSFSSWLATYADYVLNIDLAFGEFPSMAVVVPSMNFMRKGVPLSGYEWGDRVGGMVWTPEVLFESAGEPLEVAPTLSSVKGLASMIGNDVRYFYPTGTQLGGNQIPADGTYTKVVTIEDMIAAESVANDAAVAATVAGQGHRQDIADLQAQNSQTVKSDVLNNG